MRHVSLPSRQELDAGLPLPQAPPFASRVVTLWDLRGHVTFFSSINDRVLGNRLTSASQNDQLVQEDLTADFLGAAQFQATSSIRPTSVLTTGGGRGIPTVSLVFPVPQMRLSMQNSHHVLGIFPRALAMISGGSNGILGKRERWTGPRQRARERPTATCLESAAAALEAPSENTLTARCVKACSSFLEEEGSTPSPRPIRPQDTAGHVERPPPGLTGIGPRRCYRCGSYRRSPAGSCARMG